MVEIVRVPVLSDNYAWLVHDAGETVVIDPGEAAPVLAAAAARGCRTHPGRPMLDGQLRLMADFLGMTA